MKVKHSIIINRPLNDVFAFVTNLDNETSWQPEIKLVTLNGPLAVGSTFREVRVTFGRAYDWQFCITEFNPPHRISIDTISGTARYRGSRLFEAVSGGTKVTEIGELELPWLLRLFAPLLSRLSKRPLRLAYDRLKQMLEAEDGNQALANNEVLINGQHQTKKPSPFQIGDGFLMPRTGLEPVFWP